MENLHALLHGFSIAISVPHIALMVGGVLLGILVALPLAVLASRVEVLAKPMTWLAGVGQTIPSLAVLGLTLPFLGIGFRPALFALTIRAPFTVCRPTTTATDFPTCTSRCRRFRQTALPPGSTACGLMDRR